MRVRLAYGRSGLDVELEEAATTVVEPVHRPPVADPAAAVEAALRAPVAGPPLRERSGPARRWPSRPATAPGRNPAT